MSITDSEYSDAAKAYMAYLTASVNGLKDVQADILLESTRQQLEDMVAIGAALLKRGLRDLCEAKDTDFDEVLSSLGLLLGS